MFENGSALDGADHFAGIVALIVTAMVGLDLYLWLGLNKPPKLSILWIPPMAVNMWKRLVTGEDVRRWPSSWYAAMAAYSGVILLVVAYKGIRTSDDRWMAGFAAVWLAASVWKVTRRETVR
jgi:hypothetical protein